MTLVPSPDPAFTPFKFLLKYLLSASLLELYPHGTLLHGMTALGRLQESNNIKYKGQEAQHLAHGKPELALMRSFTECISDPEVVWTSGGYRGQEG